MIYNKIKIDKDAYINSGKNQIQTNFGLDNLLNISITSNANGAIFTRGLIHFPISDELTSSLNSISSSSYTATLHIQNSRNFLYTDQDFTLEFYPITQQWSEGKGDSLFSNSGAVNYIQATSSSAWTSSGCSFTASPSASFTFPMGTESINLNISGFIEYWKAGNPNYGILIKYPNSVESLTSNYISTKTFFARSANTIYKPYVDITRHDCQLMKDDKYDVHFGTNNFFFIDKNASTTAYPGSAYVLTGGTDGQTSASLNYFQPHTWYIQQNISDLSNSFALSVTNTDLNYTVITNLINEPLDATFFNSNLNKVEANVQTKEDYREDEKTTIRTFVYSLISSGMGTVSVKNRLEKVSIYFVEKNSRYAVTPLNGIEMGYDSDSYFIQFDMGNLFTGFWYFPVIIIEDYGERIVKTMEQSRFYVSK